MSNGRREIYALRWNGSAWEEMAGSASEGGISNTGESGWAPQASIALAPDSVPFVAWNDDASGTWQIYMRRWNGTTWQEVGSGSASGGGISASSGDSRSPSLAIASDGTAYIAWADDSSGASQIYVMQWQE